MSQLVTVPNLGIQFDVGTIQANKIRLKLGTTMSTSLDGTINAIGSTSNYTEVLTSHPVAPPVNNIRHYYMGGAWYEMRDDGIPLFVSQRKEVATFDIVTTTSTAGAILFNGDINIASDGEYYIDISYLYNGDSNTSDVYIEATFDGSNLDSRHIEILRAESKDNVGTFLSTGSRQKYSGNYRTFKTLTSGLKNLTLRVRTEVGGVEASAWAGTIIVERYA